MTVPDQCLVCSLDVVDCSCLDQPVVFDLGLPVAALAYLKRLQSRGTKLQRARRRARSRRRMRRDLVHAAGCALPDCCVRRYAFDDFDLVNEAAAERIRIPRSLDRHWSLR